MQIPAKLQSGQNFKQATVRTVNQIIDYLRTQRIIGDNKNIVVNQLTSGIALRVVNEGQTRGGSVANEIDHPFKLSIITTQSGEQKLKISQSRILISGDQGYRVYLGFEKNQQSLPQQLTLPTAVGVYNVIGYVIKDTAMPTNPLNKQGWGAGVVFTDYNTTTDKFTNSSGFYTFIIGQFEVKENDEGVKSYSIKKQFLFSSLEISDNFINAGFRGRFAKQNYPQDGQVVSEFLADKFIVNAGKLTCDGETVSIEEFTATGEINESKLYGLVFAKNSGTPIVQQIDFNDLVFFNPQDGKYRLPICTIHPSNSSGVSIDQHLLFDLYLNMTGKILLNNQDSVPSQYLTEKITNIATQLTDEQKEKYKNPYIIGIVNNTGSEEVKNLSQCLYWDYVSISGFDDTKQLFLTIKDGDILWDQTVGGGKVKVTQQDEQADYLYNKVKQSASISYQVTQQAKEQLIIAVNPQYFESSDNSISIQGGQDSLDFIVNISGEDCIVVDNQNGGIVVKADLQCIFNDFSITGENGISVSGSGQSWTISFDDSKLDFIKKITAGQCINTSTTGNTVSVAVDKDCIFSDFSITGGDGISVSGSGNSWTISLEQDGGSANIQAGNCINIQGTETKTISVNKSCIFSDFSVTGDDYISVNGSGNSWTLSFNADQFITSISSVDGSISITRDGSGVDLSAIGSGKVKVNANDTADYLGTKFENSNGYINFQIGNKIQAELGYFAVQSDGSIEVDCTNGFALIDVDWTKVVIDPSLAPLISKSISGETLTLSLNAPASGKYVLMANNGAVSWVETTTCESE